MKIDGTSLRMESNRLASLGNHSDWLTSFIRNWFQILQCYIFTMRIPFPKHEKAMAGMSALTPFQQTTCEGQRGWKIAQPLSKSRRCPTQHDISWPSFGVLCLERCPTAEEADVWDAVLHEKQTIIQTSMDKNSIIRAKFVLETQLVWTSIHGSFGDLDMETQNPNTPCMVYLPI